MVRNRRSPARPGALADLSPGRIILQIAILQFCYYTAAVALTVFITLVAGEHPSAGLLFDWKTIRSDVISGWTAALCWILSAVFTVVPILLLIARSKLVPDFALTILFVHLVATTLYTHSLPFSISWWVVQAVSAGIMISLGTWACQWRELQPMAFGGHAKEANGHTTASSAIHEANEDGYEMGHRRGTGRDGAGEYEMVTIPPKPEPS